jgi:hypothetical protein
MSRSTLGSRIRVYAVSLLLLSSVLGIAAAARGGVSGSVDEITVASKVRR